MIKIIICIGAPASGKSFWSINEVKKDPLHYIRINNDKIREMCNQSEYSADYEKLISATRLFMIKEAISRNLNIIVDNVNADKKHWEDVCKIAKEANKDITVMEKKFYLPLDELIERDSKREGKEQVGESIVKHFWKKLGGKQFEHYNEKVQIFNRTINCHSDFMPMEQDQTLPKCAIFDNDGTISLIHSKRNPYDARTADLDIPHEHVIECMKLYYNAGYKILFVSGREEKDREPTERFYQKHFPEIKYELFMRPTGDKRKDVIIKEEIFNNHIKGKYFISAWFDDRLQIVKWLYDSGFPVFRVNNPEASF